MTLVFHWQNSGMALSQQKGWQKQFMALNSSLKMFWYGFIVKKELTKALYGLQFIIDKILVRIYLYK